MVHSWLSSKCWIVSNEKRGIKSLKLKFKEGYQKKQRKYQVVSDVDVLYTELELGNERVGCQASHLMEVILS